MVSLENGAYRLTSITENPAGNLKFIFDLGSVDHPIYGKCDKMCGEILLLHTKESMPISNYFELTEEQQTKILNESITQFRPVLETLDEEELYKVTRFAILYTSVSIPRADCFSDMFEAGIAMSALGLPLDDIGDDMEALLSDPSTASRMFIDQCDVDWAKFKHGSDGNDESFTEKMNSFVPLPDAMKSYMMNFLKKMRQHFPNGILPDGLKYTLNHCKLSLQSMALRYKETDTMPLSEDMQKVIRGYDAGFGPVVHAIHAVQDGNPIPKKIRKSLLFKLLDTASMDFAGIVNDLLGIEKDIVKEATNENCILRSVVREGVSLEHAFNTALKRIQNLVSDIQILMRRLVEAFPEEQGLAEFIKATKEIIDGQLLGYVIAARLQYRYGNAKLEIVSA